MKSRWVIVSDVVTILAMGVGVFVIAFLVASCQTTAPAPTRSVLPPIPDASDAAVQFTDLGSQICMHLAVINCAQSKTCIDIINSKQGTFTDFHVQCLLRATSPAAAEACGTIICQTDL